MTYTVIQEYGSLQYSREAERSHIESFVDVQLLDELKPVSRGLPMKDDDSILVDFFVIVSVIVGTIRDDKTLLSIFLLFVFPITFGNDNCTLVGVARCQPCAVPFFITASLTYRCPP